MKINHLRDQRGVAMLLELVLVAAVLGLVGVAVYQSNHRANPTASVTDKKAAASNTTVGLAASASALTESSAQADANLSASAESTVDTVDESDLDVTNLGGSSNENAY